LFSIIWLIRITQRCWLTSLEPSLGNTAPKILVQRKQLVNKVEHLQEQQRREIRVQHTEDLVSSNFITNG